MISSVSLLPPFLLVSFNFRKFLKFIDSNPELCFLIMFYVNPEKVVLVVGRLALV